MVTMSPSPRIVSLIPSATEIVCALGFESHLVGRSHECDYPESVRKLPICSEPKFKVDIPSREIDGYVRAILREALSVYRVYDDVVKQVQPDVIITQTQCEVCAVSLKDVERATCDWLGSGAQIVALEPNGLDDVFADIERVADALDVIGRGKEVVAQLRQRMADIAGRTRDLADKPRVMCIEWLDPLMAAGNWMPNLVEMAGGINLVGAPGQHSPWLNWDDLIAADPDVVILLPCGFSIAKARRDLPVLTTRPGWDALSAVRRGQIYLTDGHQYFNRPGPRLVDSLEILAEIFHPDTFHFGHEGAGWQHL